MKNGSGRYRAFPDPILWILMVIFFSTTQISALIELTVVCLSVLFTLNFSIEELSEKMNIFQGMEDPSLWAIEIRDLEMPRFGTSRYTPVYLMKGGNTMFD